MKESNLKGRVEELEANNAQSGSQLNEVKKKLDEVEDRVREAQERKNRW